jgi:hypothetical protein
MRPEEIRLRGAQHGVTIFNADCVAIAYAKANNAGQPHEATLD